MKDQEKDTEKLETHFPEKENQAEKKPEIAATPT